MKQEEGRFVTLDLMRGVAALMVAIGHWTGVIPAYLAVDFFLVLSGFILAHRYLYGAPVTLYQFLAARVARLYPLHVLTLFGFALVTLVRFRALPEYADGDGYTFLLHLLLLQNVGLANTELTWNAPSWSISVEFWINVLFFLCVGRRTPSWLLLLLSTAALAILASHEHTLAVSLPDYYGVVNAGLLRGFGSFLLGVVAYRVHAGGSAVGVAVWVKGMVLVAALALLLVPRPGGSRIDFAAPFVFATCVLLFAADSARWRRWIIPAAHLGTISYSIYLVHYPIQHGIRYLRELSVGLRLHGPLVDALFDPLASFAFYLALVLLVSHLTFVYFEWPSRKTVRRWLLPNSRRELPSAERAPLIPVAAASQPLNKDLR